MLNKREIEEAKMVLAMEYIARQINDEEILIDWLTYGVTDDDIDYGSFDIAEVDEYWLKYENFKALMTTFLNCMCHAKESGGLYSAGITTYDSNENESYVLRKTDYVEYHPHSIEGTKLSHTVNRYAYTDPETEVRKIIIVTDAYKQDFENEYCNEIQDGTLKKLR